MTFTQLGLAPEILRAVRDEGYETPTPIQSGAIGSVLDGRDLIGCAQTGTGKTAAFTLPLLHRLRSGRGRRLRVLILTPTRELALQVGAALRTYGRHLRLTSAVIHGGVGYGPQESALRRGVDFLVATPGRLLDHLGSGKVDFRSLEALVIDEADRMLDMGFIRDVRRIIAALPERRQTLLFSATMPDEIRRLAREVLHDPVRVEVAPRRSAPAQGVRQSLLPVAVTRKRELLAHLVEKEALGQTLVFTRTKHGADKLARHLTRLGHGVAVLHGNRNQNQRTRALDDFKNRRARLLVATDIAGRGIDVEGIAHVVNYDMPNVPEDYVHRIGRTARAGATGDALSLVTPEDHHQVRAIETLIGSPIERRGIEGFSEEVGEVPPTLLDRSARRPVPRGHRAKQRTGRSPRNARFPDTRGSAAAAPRRNRSGWPGSGSGSSTGSNNGTGRRKGAPGRGGGKSAGRKNPRPGRFGS